MLLSVQAQRLADLEAKEGPSVEITQEPSDAKPPELTPVQLINQHDIDSIDIPSNGTSHNKGNPDVNGSAVAVEASPAEVASAASPTTENFMKTMQRVLGDIGTKLSSLRVQRDLADEDDVVQIDLEQQFLQDTHQVLPVLASCHN